MKYSRKLVAVVIFLLITSLMASDRVDNPDKPLKGQWDFPLQKEWEVDSVGEDPLAEVWMVRADEKGNAYILDVRENKVHVFSPGGKHIFSAGKKGEGPGEIRMALYFFLADDWIIIPEMARIHYFSKEGKYVKTINTERNYFSYLFLDAHRSVGTSFGTIIREEKVSDIEIYNYKSKKAQKIAQVSSTEALSHSEGGSRIALRVPETKAEVVMAYDKNNIYYGMSDRYLIHKIDIAGNKLLSFSIEGRKPKIIPGNAKRDAIKKVTGLGFNVPKNVIDAMVKQIPDEAPFFNQIYIDRQGLIYVFVSNLGNPRGREVDVFSPEGKYLYHGEIKLTDGYSFYALPALIRDNLYVFAEDEEGERKLVKYKIKMPVDK